MKKLKTFYKPDGTKVTAYDNGTYKVQAPPPSGLYYIMTNVGYGWDFKVYDASGQLLSGGEMEQMPSDEQAIDQLTRAVEERYRDNWRAYDALWDKTRSERDIEL